METYILLYQNGQKKLFEESPNILDGLSKIEKYFSGLGKTIKEVGEAYTLRIYFVRISKTKEKIDITIHKTLTSNKQQKEDTAVIWDLKGRYKETNISARLIDVKDVVYAIWDMVEFAIGKKGEDFINDFSFSLNVKAKSKELNEKQKLILFFSKKGNWGKLWSYNDIRKAMGGEGLAMAGRGIEGERPREFRYDLGYPFMTSEQDKNVPDGFCKVNFPFPTLPRNERRNATASLDKEDWSELLEILKENPKRMRCFECGLFEDETNKIGQKTKFEKSHLFTHLAGGDASKENIVAICKYCNSKQKDIYSYDTSSGKKIYHTIPFLKNRDYKDKIKAFIFLLTHLKKKDVLNIIKKTFGIKLE